MQSEGSIFIAGHSGLAGSAILRALQSRGYSRLIVRTHQELELTDARAVKDFFQHERPESVFWLLPRSEASKPTTPFLRNFFGKTY